MNPMRSDINSCIINYYWTMLLFFNFKQSHSITNKMKGHTKILIEIWSEIFEFLPFSFQISTISLVCKEWRLYFLNSGRFWHTLKVDFQGEIEKMNVQYTSFFKFCRSHKEKMEYVKSLIITGFEKIANIHAIVEYSPYFTSLNRLHWDSWNLTHLEELSKFTKLTSLKLDCCKNLKIWMALQN